MEIRGMSLRKCAQASLVSRGSRRPPASTGDRDCAGPRTLHSRRLDEYPQHCRLFSLGFESTAHLPSTARPRGNRPLEVPKTIADQGSVGERGGGTVKLSNVTEPTGP